ncbi:uncharacterized protein LOC143750680 [Siphateles boraxobius]|uniref:uncharacterized protein LOC143750680 n=1 Tax=Siphateles boraxobius TaxID=180520 RepID=UPI004064353D
MYKMFVITLCKMIHCYQLQRQPLDRVILWRVLFIMALCLISNINAQIRYSVPEETKKGSLIGNIAHDLGLDVQRLRSGRARIVSGDSTEYVELKTDKGILVVKERIDREQLCAETTPCSFTFEIILDNPMELHHVTVEILDVNDHSPTFPNDEISLEISESAAPGALFLLGSADDPDVGLNALQHYTMSPNDYFILKEHSSPDGIKYAEMVLQKPLDREQHPRLSLILIAVDGGNPQRSGNMKIEVTLLDINDNAPVFNQSVYRAAIAENAPKGTYITTVNASDADSEANSLISYSFANFKSNRNFIFKIDRKTGVITLTGMFDYERAKKHEIGIEAKDQGGLGNSAKVIVDLIDVNDNAPIINIMSFSSPVTEDATVGTTIAIFSVKDLDAGDNGHVDCTINQNIPFKLQSSLRNYYTLVTDAALDRERVAEYNITITATDSGSPALSSQKTSNLKVSDVNDNPPRFHKTVYTAYVTENNSPGLSIFTLSAQDDDWNQNARISYLLDETTVGGSPVSSFISVNADSGVVHALRGFDYEQMKSFSVCVKAQDGGSPPLSTNVTLDIIIQDQNDNAPQVLYPVQTGSSVVSEIVPRAADVGYLVTKVVAVDVDSGQNAWLSYKLQKATDRALFEVGLQNGEIRTVRQVTDKDAVKQKLTVVVEDNGQPSRSAVVSINVAVADSFPEVLSEFTDFTHEKQYNENLTFYLVLALAAVSFLFITCVVVIISVKIYRWRQSRFLYQSNLPVIPYYPPHYADTGVTGTLPHGYNYEVCMTTDSRKSDCKFSTLGGQSVLVVDPSFTETMQRAMKENNFLKDPDKCTETSRVHPLDGVYLWRILFIMAVCLLSNINAQIRYSVPEETKKGSIIGNIAHDLGLDVQRLRSGRARIVSGDSTEYVELKTDKGILVVKERIDREQLCAETTPCSFTFEIIVDNPMELHHVTVEILDVNDHSPTFAKNDISLEISESAAPGSRFLLGSADDPDVGLNALQHYTMSPNSYFNLKEHSRPDGVKYAEMVLQKPLDREQHPRLSLILTAVDGGNPQRSGNMKIEVTVLDANDNAPVFNQSVYRAIIEENARKETYITTVNASDADSGMYSLISYSFANLKGNINDIFKIDEKTGVITVIGVLDYEKAKKYEIGIEAKDQGGLGNSAKVIVDLIDVNDNAPVISVMSFSSPVTEDATVGTTIAIVSVKDLDAGDNGHVDCTIARNTPFKLQSSLRNYYTLVTDAALDRERVAEYNITITATDSGSPALSSQKTLNLKVSDVNDNPPRFQKTVYTAYVTENNSPGLSIFTLSAQDDDWNQNARISYLLDETTVGGSPVSSFISVNADSGVVHALRGFDYEQMKSFTICVKAQDGGSPPLSTNVTLDIIIQDQNDNAPQVLYPVQTGGSVVAEIVPRAADVGYLVTKVVAVDVDSGQNAWLSYKLQKATDRALFEVGLQNGEIRIVRQVTDKDAVKQKLTVVVEDNGQPSRSAVVSINVAVADSFPEVLSEFTDFTNEKQYNDKLTFYLVLALAAVSFLFITCVVVIISVKIYRWRQSRFLYQSNLPVIPYYPPHYADTGVTGTLPHGYNYEVCMTTDSRKSDCKFSTLGGQSVLVVDPSFTETMQRAMKENFLEDPELQEMEIVKETKESR